MGKPSAPAPPDYAAAAQQQGVANVNSAIATNYLNQANQVGPYGSLTYSYTKPGSGQGYTTSEGQYIPQVTATTVLSPEQQHLLDQNTNISTSLNDLASRGIQYVDQASAQPIDQSKLPSLNSGLTTNPLQGKLDYSGLGAMPTTADFQGQRNQITDAYMQRLQPYLQQQQNQLDARLASQGITHGSEAANYDYDTLNRSQNDQRIAALLAGDQAQQNLFNNSLATRQQGVNEINTQGNFANAATTQGLNNGLAAGQLNNQARQQAIQEADYFKNQPLNMLNALRTGNQVTMPQFGNVTAGSQIQAAPIFQASQAQYNAALQQYQAQMAQSSGLLGGLASLGSAAIFASDRRLKRNVRLLGKRADGLGVYAYNYVGSKAPQVGVMADEVAKLRPDALGPVRFGYATVNYGVL